MIPVGPTQFHLIQEQIIFLQTPPPQKKTEENQKHILCTP